TEGGRRHRGAAIFKNYTARSIDTDHTPDEVEDTVACVSIICHAAIQRGSPRQMNDFVRPGADYRRREGQSTQVLCNLRILRGELIRSGRLEIILKRAGGIGQSAFNNL